MNPTKTINSAYTALRRLCESSTEAERLLSNAFRDALDGEKRNHRAGRPKTSGPVRASYFVLKFALGPYSAPASWEDAATVRTDALCARGLADLLARTKPEGWRTFAFAHGPDILAIDYLELL